MHALHLSWSLLVSTACLFFSYVSANTVYVQYPIDDQYPLIARVNLTYSWTFSNMTFASTKNASLDYTAFDLPGWLNFNPSTRTFSGRPDPSDEGAPTIKVMARDPNTSDNATSLFDLCVSSTPAPKLQRSVEDQFQLPNPSLSSVFLLANNSAFKSETPALRIPPQWSFSIGFDYDTFVLDSGEDVYYGATQTNGAPLPDWIRFDTQSITFDGVTPKMADTRKQHTLSLALYASDQQGYSASSLPFNIWVSEHELSVATTSLPTINITAETPFSVTLNSPADFTGLLLDGSPLQPTDIAALQVDTDFYGDWLKYDTDTRTLSGEPPEDMDDGKEDPILPVTIVTTVNQTFETNVSLAVVPSYFTATTLQPVLVQAGNSLNFSLTPFFSNTTGVGGHDDVTLTASFDPDNSTNFLQFDPNAGTVTGKVPTNFSDYDHVSITFTAYSHITHSTSHTTLPVSLTQSDYVKSHNTSSPTGLSASTRAKLLLGLKIAFGVVGGLVAFGLGLAAFRRFARVKDTALIGEEGIRAYTEEERKWYGIDAEGDTYTSPKDFGMAKLARTMTKHTDGSGTFSPASPLSSPAVMRKSEFLGRIRGAARQVSDTMRIVSNTIVTTVGGGSTARRRPVIGKPVLLMAEDGRRADANGLGFDNRAVRAQTPGTNPFGDEYAASAMTGTSLVGSPSSSTGGRSIPRRRPDFAPKGTGRSPLLPATPPQAHTATIHGVKLSRQRSADSEMSLDSDESHINEAVVQKAERARSVRSVRSGSVMSFQTHRTNQTTNTQEQGAPRPRLVPFTSSSRVPVPKADGEGVPAESAEVITGKSKKRVVSQIAKVFRSASTERRFEDGQGGEGGDELSVGIEYVRALGDDLRSGEASADASPSPSFSVAESSHMGRSTSRGRVSPDIPTPVPRMLSRAGEFFRFRVALTLPASAATALEVRLMSGQKLPKFVKADVVAVSGRDQKRTVELSGVPTKADMGEYNVGVYEKGTVGECVGRVVLEVVERS
ncbi:hypothetical protein EIP86_001118 [Pleurotus ostreatoroseus]|nr:hypothetical protein EIP86_001118 [Pleurotus ostreatoroseus]